MTTRNTILRCGILLFISGMGMLVAQPRLGPDLHERDSILLVIRNQQEQWNRGNLEGYMEGYAVTDSIRFASGGNVSFGWEKMLGRFRRGYPDKRSMGTLEFSGLDIQLLTPDAAMVFGKWKLLREQDAPWGYFTLLFRKNDGRWRIVHDHTSSATEQ